MSRRVLQLVGNASRASENVVLLALFLLVPIASAYCFAYQAHRAGLRLRRPTTLVAPFFVIGLLVCAGAARFLCKESLDPWKDTFDRNSYCLFNGSFWPALISVGVVALVVSGALTVGWSVSAHDKVPKIDLRLPDCGVRPYLDFVEFWCLGISVITGATTAVSLSFLSSTPTRTNRTLAPLGVVALGICIVLIIRLVRRALDIREQYRSAARTDPNWKDLQPDPTDGFLGRGWWQLPTCSTATLGIVVKLLEWSGIARLLGQ